MKQTYIWYQQDEEKAGWMRLRQAGVRDVLYGVNREVFSKRCLWIDTWRQWTNHTRVYVLEHKICFNKIEFETVVKGNEKSCFISKKLRRLRSIVIEASVSPSAKQIHYFLCFFFLCHILRLLIWQNYFLVPGSDVLILSSL